MVKHAPTGGTFCHYLPPVTLDNHLDESQPQPAARINSGIAAPVKAVKELREFIAGNTDARIFDPYSMPGFIWHGTQPHRDAAIGRRKLERVVE